jgi:hypothetical protein
MGQEQILAVLPPEISIWRVPSLHHRNLDVDKREPPTMPVGGAVLQQDICVLSPVHGEATAHRAEACASIQFIDDLLDIAELNALARAGIGLLGAWGPAS